MKGRNSFSITVGFGVLDIKVKLYNVGMSEKVEFTSLTPAGNALSQETFDSVTKEKIKQNECLKKYSIDGRSVAFSDAELLALQGCELNKMNIDAFVPVDEIDSYMIESSYFLAPDKEQDRGYRMLQYVMNAGDMAAVGIWHKANRDQLVAIRCYDTGLVINLLFHYNELRAFDDESKDYKLSQNEMELASQLMHTMAVNKFDCKKYMDKFPERVKAAAYNKLKNVPIAVDEIKIPPAPVLNLEGMLNASLPQQRKNKKNVA